MIVKYVLEQKYNASKEPDDLARLEAFENKYNATKEEYQKVRDNSLTLELRLIKSFVDGISPKLELYYGKTYSKVLLKFVFFCLIMLKFYIVYIILGNCYTFLYLNPVMNSPPIFIKFNI